MEERILLDSFPIKTTLSILLEDKTTKKNIIWATKSYADFGDDYKDSREITIKSLLGLDSLDLQPRIAKAIGQQQERTKAHAEVFTPSWICNKMNNFCDEDWFGRSEVFNREMVRGWETIEDKVFFPEGKTWKEYVDSRRLEITCGEAPFLVSRYDATTGDSIEVKDRIGILDRKLRIVGENTESFEDWYSWTLRAFQSTYGYEYQGDNLLIGRINLLMTFVDYMRERWGRKPDETELKKVANIIAWNLWQMDGLTGTIPLGVPEEATRQYSLFDFGEDDTMKPITQNEKTTPICLIYDWRAGKSVKYDSLKESK